MRCRDRRASPTGGRRCFLLHRQNAGWGVRQQCLRLVARLRHLHQHSRLVLWIDGTNFHQSRRPANLTALTFPLVTIRDIVRAQAQVLDELGVEQLRIVIGASIGGMQALQWAVDYPERVEHCIAIGTAPLSAMGLALNHLQRQAIRLDPKFHGGKYPPYEQPAGGLGLARAIAMCSYKSAELFDERYARKPNRNGEDPLRSLDHRYDVAGYLDYQGEKVRAALRCKRLPGDFEDHGHLRPGARLRLRGGGARSGSRHTFRWWALRPTGCFRRRMFALWPSASAPPEHRATTPSSNRHTGTTDSWPKWRPSPRWFQAAFTRAGWPLSRGTSRTWYRDKSRSRRERTGETTCQS